ncbi:DUF421 domain-containing protein [Deinococcus piscis]|uniref:DUF421 domain-containing protein n=1 Tax=Deinococcus piscis TaxID=394230 RepID=UPI00167A3495|nr:YetF domain-containing protein [Deinococcus piscis]
MSADVQPFDWHRMFVGDLTPLFMLEIVFRTVVIFAWLLLLLRLSGQRSLTQLGPLELAIVIALGSAAGDPMFYADVPLLHGMLSLALVVGMQHVISRLIVRSETVETLLQGVPLEMVRDGVLDRENMSRANLSQEDVFEYLRRDGVRQLGEVQRAYLEQNGTFSVFKYPHGQVLPGLQVTPPWDLEPPQSIPPAAVPSGPQACRCCGRLLVPESPEVCPCGERERVPAVKDPLDDQIAVSVVLT